MARRNANNYFIMLEDMVRCAGDAASKLQCILQEFHPDRLTGHMKELHVIENTGDELKHLMVNNLAKEFITPIDREDFLGIAGEIDDVIDSIEDVLLKIYMFNITEIREEAFCFADIVKKCCAELEKTMREFPNFKKPTIISRSVIEVNRLEEEGDALYMEAVRRLYVEHDNPVEIMAWMEVFTRFEKCCDACEHVANRVENVVMKNI